MGGNNTFGLIKSGKHVETAWAITTSYKVKSISFAKRHHHHVSSVKAVDPQSIIEFVSTFQHCKFMAFISIFYYYLQLLNWLGTQKSKQKQKPISDSFSLSFYLYSLNLFDADKERILKSIWKPWICRGWAGFSFC